MLVLQSHPSCLRVVSYYAAAAAAAASTRRQQEMNFFTICSISQEYIALLACCMYHYDPTLYGFGSHDMGVTQ